MKTRYKRLPVPIPYTKEGLERLKIELKQLVEDRKEAVMHVARAREMGDLSENGYYKSYKAKLGQIDNRTRRISYTLLHARLIQKPSADRIDLGSKLILQKDGVKTAYEIVGRDEADPSSGRLSHLSPLGKALLGHREGDVISVISPKGRVTYQLLKIL